MRVVWSCYKYLKLLHVAQIVGSYIEADNEVLFLDLFYCREKGIKMFIIDL